uniref:Uncharacterized protein n=1 Tax=Oryza glumipatula TaxID=40148 RepID=A0A0E0AYQ0_9ORYZ
MSALSMTSSSARRNSALDQSPEQSLNSALKINDVQLQRLRCKVDSSTERAISLASASSLTTLQPSWSSEADFLLIFLNCFCAFLAGVSLSLGLNCCIITPLDGQLHLLGARLELREALLHGVAEVKQGERPLQLLLHSSPLLKPEAGQAHHLIHAASEGWKAHSRI